VVVADCGCVLYRCVALCIRFICTGCEEDDGVVKCNPLHCSVVAQNTSTGTQGALLPAVIAIGLLFAVLLCVWDRVRVQDLCSLMYSSRSLGGLLLM
jgi:hypothetical protein